MTTAELSFCTSRKTDGSRCGGVPHLKLNGYNGFWEVHCYSCCSGVWHDEKDEVVKIWNECQVRMAKKTVSELADEGY